MIRPLLLSCALVALTSCSGLYYEAMKKLGKEKRDILVGRLVSGQKAQQEAKEQIQTTLEAFQKLTGFEGYSGPRGFATDSFAFVRASQGNRSIDLAEYALAPAARC